MTLTILIKIKHRLFGHPADYSTKTSSGYICLLCGDSFKSRNKLYK